MTKVILIDEPGAGEWIMEQVGGMFCPGRDHVISTHDPETRRVRGGFVVCSVTEVAKAVHMAGGDEHWCSRDLLWMLFYYVFRQLGARKLIAPVASTNYSALDQCLRAGFVLETMIRNATPDGHLMVLTMEATHCRWLMLLPRQYLPGEEIRRRERERLAQHE